MKTKCTVKNCKNQVYAKKMCVNHYDQHKRRDPTRPKCKIEGCKNPTYTKGICNKHRHQKKTGIIREELFKILGGKKCAECGYSNEISLAFDHIHDDGYKDRKSKNYSMQKYVDDPNLARKRLQVLCYNCNTIKEIKRVQNH